MLGNASSDSNAASNLLSSNQLLDIMNVSKFGSLSTELLRQYKDKLEVQHLIQLTQLKTNYQKQVNECKQHYQLIKSCLEHHLQLRVDHVAAARSPPSTKTTSNTSSSAGSTNSAGSSSSNASNSSSSSSDIPLPSSVLPNFPLLPNAGALALPIHPIHPATLNLPPSLASGSVHGSPPEIFQIQTGSGNACITSKTPQASCWQSNSTKAVDSKARSPIKLENSVNPANSMVNVSADEALVIQILTEMRQNTVKQQMDGQLDTLPPFVAPQSASASASCSSGGSRSCSSSASSSSASSRSGTESLAMELDMNSMPKIEVSPPSSEQWMQAARRTVKRENGGVLHECQYPECSYSTSNQAHLRKHIRTHTDERPFECSICHKAFKQKSNLKTHIRIHTGQRPFKCKMCGKTFTQRSSLVQHEKIHSGEKPFVCLWPGCGKQFKRKDHLKSHQRVHTGEKPEKCTWEGCNRRFATPQQLRLHTMDHTGTRPYVCERVGCGKSFKTKSLLTRHKDTHLDVKPYQCVLCVKGFTRKAHYKKHMKDRHNQEIEDPPKIQVASASRAL